MFVLDTDLLVDALRGKKEGAQALALYQDLQVAITSVTAFELLLGAIRSGSQKSMDATRNLVASLDVLDFDLAASEKTAALFALLSSKGQAIEIRDAMIAGIAVSRSATVVTRNIRHFSRVKGLEVKRW